MVRIRFVQFCIIILVSSFFVACEKEVIVEKIVTKTDTLFIQDIDTIVIQKTDTVTLTQFVKDSATTFILSRHAETSGAGADPNLSTAGQDRANLLAKMLKPTTIHAVYATNFNRTKQTAAPVASNYNVTTQIYDSNKLNEFVGATLTQYNSKIVYVAGHSNTTPSLLNILIGSNVYTTFPESEYDNLFIVNVFEKGRAKVTHLKY